MTDIIESRRKKREEIQKKRRFKIILSISIVVLLMVTATIYAYSNIAQTTDSTNPKAQLDGIDIETIVEEGDYYLSVQYPTTGNSTVNAQIKSFIDNEINHFKKDCESRSDSQPGELYIEFHTHRHSDTVISFLYNIYTFHDKEAHGTNCIRTDTYNLKTGQSYVYDDIFTQTASDQLSALSYEKLSKRNTYTNDTEKGFLEKGTRPNPKNFKHFVLEETGIRLYFEQYQIASGVNGSEELFLPFSKLKDVMKEIPEINLKNIAPKPEPSTAKHSETETEITTKEPQTTNLADIYKGKKLIALTFDDGPHKTLTPRLLKILKREDVKATFYVLGSRVAYYPEILQQAANEGHQIGSHTYNHKLLTNISDKDRKKEIRDTEEIIKKAIGSYPTTMRPPYGGIDANVKKECKYPLVLWSVDPEDWKYLNANTVYNKVVKNVTDGDIVLLHDIHETSVEAAEKIIKKLKKDGYEFVTVDQLIALRDNGNKKKEKVYGALRP